MKQIIKVAILSLFTITTQAAYLLEVDSNDGYTMKYQLEFNQEACTTAVTGAFNVVNCHFELAGAPQSFLVDSVSLGQENYFDMEFNYNRGALLVRFFDGTIDAPAPSQYGADMFLKEITEYYQENPLFFILKN